MKNITEKSNTLSLEKLNEGEKTDLKNQEEPDRKAA
jgi:hypothetical protein